MGQLNYDDIQKFVNDIELKQGTKLKLEKIRELMDDAVKDFDRMLISDDLGTLLKSITEATDEDGNVTNMFGVWKYNYTFNNPGGTTTTVKKGDEVKNLREFLICTIVNLLYSGDLQTMLFKLVNGALGSVLYNLDLGDSMPGAVTGFPLNLGDEWNFLPEALRAAIPTMPHWFTENWNGNSRGQSGVQWKQWFTGEAYGNSRYDYTAILKVLEQAPIYGSGSSSQSYWKDNDGAKRQGTSGIPESAWEALDSTAAWHIENDDDLYHSLATVFCGLAVPLATIITGDTKSVETRLLNLDATIYNNGDALYDRLFIPLYRLLGINPRSYDSKGGFYSGTDIKNACPYDINWKGETVGITPDGGVTFWKMLISPIIYWLNNKLFVNPIETILEILPNLLTALDDNQILPKLKNLALKLEIKPLGISIKFDLNLTDILVPVLNDIGLTDAAMEGGINGLLKVLLTGTRVTGKPSAADIEAGGWLMKVTELADGTKETSTTEAAVVNIGGTNYYIKACGLLTQTLYSALGDGLFNWFTWTNNVGTIPLQIPVNRFMATGTLMGGAHPNSQSLVIQGCQKTITNYHIYTDPGDTLLTLFRWLLDDGTIYVISPLLEGMIPVKDDGSSVLDTVFQIVDGQADTLLGILICLLNAYSIDFTAYKDPARNPAIWGKNNAEGTDFKSYLNTDYSTKFQVGKFLQETLCAKNTAVTDPNTATTADMIAKADLAIANLDVVIGKLVPTLVSLLGDTLRGLGLGMEEVITKVENGELTTIKDIVVQGVVGNDLVDMLMKLLFGTKEQKVNTAEDGTTTPEVDANGNPVIDNGLLGSLLGDPNSIIVKLLDALATFGIDITPLGFYNCAIGTTSSKNGQIAAWLNRQAANHQSTDPNYLKNNAGSHKLMSDNAAKAELAKMTWADIGVEAGFGWFAEDADASKRLDNFIELVCDFIGPLNPLLGFLLSGQNITLMDELTLQGNQGYSKAVVPILEALGLDSACVYQKQFDAYVYCGTDLNTDIMSLPTVTDPNQLAGSARLATTKNSPLRPLMNAIKTLLLGDGTNKGLLEAPVTVLLSKLPNIAYFMYMYKTDDGKRTSNLSIAVQNFIAPILKLLQIVDPILSRVIVLDLEETLNNVLDFETLINTLLGRLVGDGATFNLDLLDFGTLAANSSLRANINAPTYRGNVGDKFTKFEASPGQFFITLMRSAASKELIDALAGVINGLFTKNPAKDQAEVESRERINNIIKIISTNLCKPVTDADANGAQYIDILSGLLIDVLTDYEPADGEFYFYEVLNRIDNQLITDVEQTTAWTDYAIDHEGYDWNATADKFTEADVNTAIENLDYVIKQAVPDVLSALSEEGMLDLGGMQFDFEAGDGLWTLLQNIISENLFTDNIFDTVVNLLCGALGKSGSNETTSMLANVLKAAGFDMTYNAFLYDKDGGKTTFYDYMTYGFDKDADGNLIPAAGNDMYMLGGEAVELTWAQIYKNHSYIAYEFDKDGNLVTNADGSPKLLQATTTNDKGEEVPAVDKDGNPIYVRELRKTGAVQLRDASGNYLYTYTDENGDEQTYASEYDQLKIYTVGTGATAKTYTLSAKYDETAAKDWAWGMDNVTGADANETYYAKKNKMIEIIWSMLTPFAPVFSALFAGDALKLFEGINIEGNTAYENVLLPLLRAFGFEETIKYLSTTPSEVDGKTKLDLINDARPEGEKIPATFMSVEEYYTLVYGDAAGPESGNAMSAEGMGKAVATMANYVFNFVEVVATYPIQTIMTALPTLAYFIYGDGLTTLVSNVLVPITTLTDRLEPIVKLDINNIGAGLLDALSTGNWANFQNALQTYVSVDEETGEIIVNETQQFSLTDSILNLLGSLEFDLSGVLGKNDDNIEEGEYKYGLMLFINKEVEVRAKELLATANKLEKEDATANREAVEQLRAEARNLRGGTLKGFFKSIAALGTSYGALGETAPNGGKSTNVKVNNFGQVTVSKAEVLMFLLNFAFDNLALKQTVGSLLGYDLTDENTDEAEMLDEIITNVFNNPEALVDLVVELLTSHDITKGIEIDLMEIEAETHYDFYEDAGFESHEEVLEAIKNGEDVSEISRMKTAAAIDNLDSLVGTILNLFKENLITEGSFFEKIGLTKDSDLTLKAVVDALFEQYLYTDKGLNEIMGMLISTLGAEGSSQIINVVLKILDGAGYSLTPQTFKKNLPQLSGVIGDAKKWSEVAKNNAQYKYAVKDDKGNTIETLYSATQGETAIDGKAVVPVMIQEQEVKTAADGTKTYVYTYTVGEGDAAVVTEIELDKAGETTWTDSEGTAHVLSAKMVDTAKQETGVVINVSWNVTDRDSFVALIWDMIKPLSGIFEAFLAGGTLVIYDKVNISGTNGYESVILPVIENLAINKLTNTDGTPYLAEVKTYADYKALIDDDDPSNDSIMLTSITDALFALIDSVCDRPVSTIATIIPYLARFLESNGLDALISNILVPVTTILTKVEPIYDLNLLKTIKDLLRDLVKKMNAQEGATTENMDPAQQPTPGASAAAYALNVIEDTEAQANDNTTIAQRLLAPSALADETVEQEYYFIDIIWQLLDSVKINGTAIGDMVSDTLFVDLASCAWLPAAAEGEKGSDISIVTIDADGRGGNISYAEATEYTVDRETVLLKVLEWVVFTDGIRDLLGGLLNINFDMAALTEEDSNYLITVLLYGIFQDPEAAERLVIDLLSWYEVEYQPVRTKADYSDLSTATPIDYEGRGIDKSQLEQLPEKLDTLVAGIIPVVVGLLPEGALGNIKITGSNMEEILHNLVVDLLKGDDKNAGLGNKLIAMLVKLIGSNDSIGSILPMLKELTVTDTNTTGVDLTLKYFKQSSAALNTVFADCETWADAYEAFKVKVKYVAPENPAPDYVAPLTDADGYLLATDADGKAIPVYATDKDGNKIQATDNGTMKDGYYITAGNGAALENTYVVKTDASGNVVYEYQYDVEFTGNNNIFNIGSYDDVLAILGDILTPLVPILRLLLTEDHLVILDGVTITAGDGYDRFIIPIFEALGIDGIVDKNEFRALEDGAFVDKIISYIDALLTKIVSSPVQTIVDALPQLVFFIYSEGLAQSIEQLVAPLITLVDMVNDITAKKVEAEGKEFVALDIYGMILDIVNEKVMTPNDIAPVDSVYGLINSFLTAEGLEALLKKIIDKKNTETGGDLEADLGFQINGLFKMIIEKCCVVTDVKTVRYFGATETTGGRTVKGVQTNAADTIMQIIADTILGGDMIKSLLTTFGVQVNDTVTTILDAITGENKDVIIKVLLNYFFNYDVETMLLEYLSFDKIEYAY